jgi:hypothetical protein
MPPAVWSHPGGWPQPDDEVTTMNSIDEASAILNHYFAQLARANGLKWSERNAQDIQHAADLLATDDESALDEIPPFRPALPPQLDTRVTQVLTQEEQQLRDFEIWKKQRAEDERVNQARRMMRR